MKCFFIFLKNSLNNSLNRTPRQKKNVSVNFVFTLHYDRDKSETKHGCCKQSLFLNK